MKYKLVLLISVLFFFLIGCATTEDAAIESNDSIPKEEITNAAIENEEKIDFPEWAISIPQDSDYIYAFGYGKMSNIQNSLKRAQAEARSNLAEYLNTEVESISTTYSKEDKHIEELFESMEYISKQRSNAVLERCEQVEVYMDSNNGVWVLMRIPKEKVEEEIAVSLQSATDQMKEKTG